MVKPVAIVSVVGLFILLGYTTFTTSGKISKLQTTLSEKKVEYQKALDDFNAVNKSQKDSTDVKKVLVSAKADGEKVASIQTKMVNSNDESLLSELSDLMVDPVRFTLLPVKNAEWRFITNYSVVGDAKLPVGFIYTDGDKLYGYVIASYIGGKFSDVDVKLTKTYIDTVYNPNGGHESLSPEDVSSMVDQLNSMAETSETDTTVEPLPDTVSSDEEEGIQDYMSEDERESLANVQNGGE